MTHSFRRIAVWIDQREAILAIFNGGNLSKEEEIRSHIEQEPHHHDWTRSHVQAYKHEHLKQYYAEIIEHLRPADEILLLGPGTAKQELHHQIDAHKGLKGKITAVKNSAKMDENELVTYASHFFGLK
ncbi:MAG: hypothetical protein H6667_08970 [Ardenticatenaceae bacterium]|nr:hypothetical protein [Ardenticatenaceae bacterium]MCB9445222.1 hypothetical protein [Ardenticatenaceae bacterium]